MKTAIIIPSFNERENLPKLIDAILSYLPGALIIVVDDSSPDQTAQVVKKLQKRYHQLYLIKRPSKGGRGSAVLEGFAKALKLNADVLVEMDADLSHNPAELPQLVSLSRPKVVILASRYVKGSQIPDWPIRRKFSSRIYNLIIKLMLGLPMIDNTNGYRIYSRKASEILISHQFQNKGYMALSEGAYLLHKKGFKFKEVSSVFVNRKMGKSNTNLKELTSAFKGLIKIRKSVG